MKDINTDPSYKVSNSTEEYTEMSERVAVNSCPICQGRRLHYVFSHSSYRVVRCDDCRLLMLSPQPSDAELDAIYSHTYFLGDNTDEARERVARMKRATARLYLDKIASYRDQVGGRLLEIGCGHGDFLVEARQVGFEVTGVEIARPAAVVAAQRLGGGSVVCGPIEGIAQGNALFDVCVISDVIEHTRDPLEFLRAIRRLLKPGGVLFIATPTLDSWSARLLRQNWMEFKPEHLFYFDTVTIQNALYQAGFQQVIVEAGRKILNFDYVAHHFHRFPIPFITPIVQVVTELMPKALRYLNIPVVASGMMVYAQATELRKRPLLSVVVPVYNEANTIERLMQALLAKTLPDIDIEIIIVESNSSDGSREIVQHYQGYPRVKLVLEDQPRGKGHAVRTGFQHAQGDFILIQDADLEYDLEDYDVLIEPLVQGREAFVLGSRHGGAAWKMRHFADMPLVSMALNFGHWLFATLVNVTFGLRLRDPFTMYKVFRRDCLTGLEFTYNRFDFDYELLVKLVRKGYMPIEIPVNYRSRSFAEGKKVSVTRDPLTWLAAIIRLRFTRIDPLRVLKRQRGIID
jgi:SAM-dependent methyltransferase